ncbi:GNAT family N-acetyltransferase [Nocardia callitridis]|uniref:GNAT family N-acetyltransferase n=1 Tax=Nocardia callitridis TaxID=648753 RepID=A0ABP9KIS7_9NOCA
MAPSTVDVHQLTPEQWRTFRHVRLRALSDTPRFFGTTLAQARQRTESDWRQALSDRSQYLARLGGTEIGTVGGMVDPDRGGVHLISMWVAPEARGTGASDALVRAVIDGAVSDGHTLIWLEVVEENIFAERLYSRNGFVRTGVVCPTAPEDPRLEFEMVRRIGICGT